MRSCLRMLSHLHTTDDRHDSALRLRQSSCQAVQVQQVTVTSPPRQAMYAAAPGRSQLHGSRFIERLTMGRNRDMKSRKGWFSPHPWIQRVSRGAKRASSRYLAADRCEAASVPRKSM